MEHTHLVKGLDYALLTKASLCVAAAAMSLQMCRRPGNLTLPAIQVKEEQVRVPVTAKETQAKARAVKQVGALTAMHHSAARPAMAFLSNMHSHEPPLHHDLTLGCMTGSCVCDLHRQGRIQHPL